MRIFFFYISSFSTSLQIHGMSYLDGVSGEEEKFTILVHLANAAIQCMTPDCSISFSVLLIMHAVCCFMYYLSFHHWSYSIEFLVRHFSWFHLDHEKILFCNVVFPPKDSIQI